MDADVVYKRGREWFTGKIKDDKLRKKKQIKKLSEITDTESYITIKQWIKVEKSKLDPDEYLKTLKIDRLYIKEAPKKVSFPKESKKDALLNFVDDKKKNVKSKSPYNEICLGCKKTCKQLSTVQIIKCLRIPQ